MHPPLGEGLGAGPGVGDGLGVGLGVGAGAHFVTEYAVLPVHFLAGPAGAPLKLIHVPTV